MPHGRRSWTTALYGTMCRVMLNRCSVVAATLSVVISLAGIASPQAHAAACADYPNQAAAQKAADTRDGDGDGVYCESLPCPCSKASGRGGSKKPKTPAAKVVKKGCVKPRHTQLIGFSATKYPNIRSHYLAAIKAGWPRFLVLNRPGASARRDRLLRDVPTRDGFDRDEYPPAVARGRGFHIRGLNPRGWKAPLSTCKAMRIGHTVRRSGSSFAAFATEHCSGMSSTDPARSVLCAFHLLEYASNGARRSERPRRLRGWPVAG